MKKGKKLHATVQILIILAIVVFISLISNAFFLRIDLTDDQRYTVSDASKELLSNLEEEILITCFYTGEMPPYYKSLEEGTQTLLQELYTYSNGNLDYQFIDPGQQKELLTRFAKIGYQPFPVLFDLSDTETREVMLMPYIELTYKGKTKVINLISGSIYRGQGGRLDFDPDKANRELEYKLVSTIFNMTREQTQTIALLAGHGEYRKEAMADLFMELDPIYNIIYADIRNGRPLYPDEVALLLVLQPQLALSEREKYEIDQYLMRGGRILWLADNQIIDFTIGEQASTLTELRATNVDDFFMRHGMKLNYDLVQDLNCGFIDAETYTSTFGNSRNQKPWPFNPLVYNFGAHASTRYINNVLIRMGSSIDTFPTVGLRKSVLMASTRQTRILEGRQYINVDQAIRQQPDPKKYAAGHQFFGVLAEGQFRSLYAGRQIPRDSLVRQLPKDAQVTQSTGAPMLAVISDGEFATGEFIGGQSRPLPADNKALMQNLIDIMCGQDLITKIRVREINRRTLDRDKYKGNEQFYQLLNIVLPVLLLLIFGIVREYLRSRRNKSYQDKQP